MTTQDFKARMDIDALLTVSGSEMDQLINAALPADDKGLRIITVDFAENTPVVPNPDVLLEGVVPTYWRRYKWVRQPFVGSALPVREYNWNENAVADPTFLKWQITVDITSINANIFSALTQVNLANDTAAAAQLVAQNAAVQASNALILAGNVQTEIDSISGTVTGDHQQINSIDTRVFNLENPFAPLPMSKGGTGQSNLQGAINAFGLKNVPRVIFILYELQGMGVDGGTFIAGAQQKRKLNALNASVDVTDPIYSYCTLNNDSTFTLVAGRWLIEAEAPAVNVGHHKASLVNADSQAVYLPVGSSEYTGAQVIGGDAAANVSNKSKVAVALALTAAFTKLQISHYCQTTQLDHGLGYASNFNGLAEIYTQVKVTYLGVV